MMLAPGKRLAVFSIKEIKKGQSSIWTRAGTAWVNKDGSMNITMEVFPIDGRLHVREAGERKEVGPAPLVPTPGTNTDTEAPAPLTPMAVGVAG